MSRFWGTNIVIEGSTIKERFEDPLANLYPTGEGPPRFVTHDTSNPQAGTFEVATQDVVRQISKTSVGGILIQQVNAWTSRTVTIRPLNAVAVDLTGADADDGQAARTRGTGSNVTIWYDPATWSNTNAKVGIDPANHYRADDILFHELIHALRMMKGLWNPVRIVNWDNVEDLFAIMLTNIYLSSNNRNSDLRGDHQKLYHPLPNSLLRPSERQSDQTFYLQNDTYIDGLRHSMPEICAPITAINCNWNPLKAGVNYMNAVQRMFR